MTSASNETNNISNGPMYNGTHLRCCRVSIPISEIDKSATISNGKIPTVCLYDLSTYRIPVREIEPIDR